ncbi:hypothetical protein LguiA_035886 [Lonicera macranthoides]
MHATKDRVESDTSTVYSISLYESTITTRDEPWFGELKLTLGVIGLPVTARDRILRCSPPVVGTTRAGPGGEWSLENVERKILGPSSFSTGFQTFLQHSLSGHEGYFPFHFRTTGAFALGYVFMDDLGRAVSQFYPSFSGGMSGGSSTPPVPSGDSSLVPITEDQPGPSASDRLNNRIEQLRKDPIFEVSYRNRVITEEKICHIAAELVDELGEEIADPEDIRKARSERTKLDVVMSEFAPICIYLVISPLVSLIPLGVPFPFSSNSSTYPEKLSAYECGFDPSGDARSRFDIRFYLVSILFIIPDPEVTFSFPWAVPLNKIDPFGSWSMMAFLLILTIGSLYEWKRGASDRE